MGISGAEPAVRAPITPLHVCALLLLLVPCLMYQCTLPPYSTLFNPIHCSVSAQTFDGRPLIVHHSACAATITTKKKPRRLRVRACKQS
ncbi:hypothetical protein BS50DRAFT_336574 [Corynespora cassiicola Philippines]|uniref:Secreted protein n=1 Tax=Corynespora cassiicola Philippines TaxID=1448308 RepID=A0A2T2NV42_CORCC|nr:hypothetical protein BS50DRAFT_336574 [Corynespora cassiicola Philippines]